MPWLGCIHVKLPFFSSSLMAFSHFNKIKKIKVISLKYCARTYDEKEVMSGDIVQVTVEFQREHTPWKLDKKKYRCVQKMPAPELEAKKRRALKKKAESGDEGAEGWDEKEDYEEDHGLDFVDESISEEARLKIARKQAPVVHVNRFPFRVKEKWMIILIDQMIPAVVDQCAIPDLTGRKQIDLHFRMNRPPGKYRYILVAKCDSYLGADKSVEFELDVKEPIERVGDFSLFFSLSFTYIYA